MQQRSEQESGRKKAEITYDVLISEQRNEKINAAQK